MTQLEHFNVFDRHETVLVELSVQKINSKVQKIHKNIKQHKNAASDVNFESQYAFQWEMGS